MRKADQGELSLLHSVRSPPRRVGYDCVGPSRTRQEFAEECDINAIMKRYQKTGVLQHYNTAQPRYLDLSGSPDFHVAMDLMIQADHAFMRLPAEVRKRFANDPQDFVAFASDPENIDQLRRWDLAPPAPVVEPPPASPPPERPQGDPKA